MLDVNESLQMLETPASYVRQCEQKTVKNAHPLILWWELLHSASLYRMRFTHPVSSHLKLKCPYQLVTGVPPASSQLHRKNVREKLE